MKRSVSKDKMITEITKLELQEKELSCDLRIQKDRVKKAKSIKRLTLFSGIAKLVMPFCVTTGIVLGACNISELSFPIILDNERKEKIYTLEIDQEHGIETNEYYDDTHFNDKHKQSNITIYTPWEKDGDYMVRSYSKFKMNKLTDPKVYYSLLENNYNYIFENYKFEVQETEKVNYINFVNDEDDMKVEANIYIIDENDNIYVKETTLKNIVSTILELLFVVGISSIVVSNTKDKILLSIRRKNAEYINELRAYNSETKKLNGIRNNLSMLKKKVKKYEK